MKKDIEFPESQFVKIAIAPGQFENDLWEVILINFQPEAIKNILVASTGFGRDNEGKEVQTSTLRHFFDELEGNHFIEVEKIDPGVFHLSNEYWVSYWKEGKLYDQRILFVTGSIGHENCVWIEMLGKEAILHS